MAWSYLEYCHFLIPLTLSVFNLLKKPTKLFKVLAESSITYVKLNVFTTIHFASSIIIKEVAAIKVTSFIITNFNVKALSTVSSFAIITKVAVAVDAREELNHFD